MTNLAARLCGEAKAGQILVSPRVAGAEGCDRRASRDPDPQGFLKPIEAFNVVGVKKRV